MKEPDADCKDLVKLERVRIETQHIGNVQPYQTRCDCRLRRIDAEIIFADLSIATSGPLCKSSHIARRHAMTAAHFEHRIIRSDTQLTDD